VVSQARVVQVYYPVALERRNNNFAGGEGNSHNRNFLYGSFIFTLIFNILCIEKLSNNIY
jgi:hypothetical protein